MSGIIQSNLCVSIFLRRPAKIAQLVFKYNARMRHSTICQWAWWCTLVPLYISIVAPKPKKCVPILLGLKPRCVLPMVAQADLSVVITCLDVICLCLAWFQTVSIFRSAKCQVSPDPIGESCPWLDWTQNWVLCLAVDDCLMFLIIRLHLKHHGYAVCKLQVIWWHKKKMPIIEESDIL